MGSSIALPHRGHSPRSTRSAPALHQTEPGLRMHGYLSKVIAIGIPRISPRQWPCRYSFVESVAYGRGAICIQLVIRFVGTQAMAGHASHTLLWSS